MLLALRPAIAGKKLPFTTRALLDVAVHVVNPAWEHVTVAATRPVIPGMHFAPPANALVPPVAERHVGADAGRRFVHLLVAVATDRHRPHRIAEPNALSGERYGAYSAERLAERASMVRSA